MIHCRYDCSVRRGARKKVAYHHQDETLLHHQRVEKSHEDNKHLTRAVSRLPMGWHGLFPMAPRRMCHGVPKTARFGQVGLSAMFGGGVMDHHAGRSARRNLTYARPAAQPPPPRFPDVGQRTRAAPTLPNGHDRRAGRATTADARAASLPLTPTG